MLTIYQGVNSLASLLPIPVQALLKNWPFEALLSERITAHTQSVGPKQGENSPERVRLTNFARTIMERLAVPDL